MVERSEVGVDEVDCSAAEDIIAFIREKHENPNALDRPSGVHGGSWVLKYVSAPWMMRWGSFKSAFCMRGLPSNIIIVDYSTV